MHSFSELAKDGINKIKQEDSESQENFLKAIAEERNTSVSAIKRADAFFVPNDEYMGVYFGSEIRDPEYDCYDANEQCRWCNWLVFPIYDVVGDVAGFGGFNPFLYAKAHEEGDWSIAYYQYSSSKLFPKGRYLYTVNGVYEKAIRDGYLFLVDGLFDCLSLTEAGFNAAALMGSSLTQEVIMLLRFVKRVILIADNDDAGIKLYNQLRKRINRLELFKQNKTKDIDELLKSEYGAKVVRKLTEIVQTDRYPLPLVKF